MFSWPAGWFDLYISHTVQRRTLVTRIGPSWPSSAAAGWGRFPFYNFFENHRKLINSLLFSRHAILPRLAEEKEGDEDSDNEPEDMDTEDVGSCSLTQRCISLLNAQAHVNSLVRIVERGGGGGGVVLSAAPAFAASSFSTGTTAAAVKYSAAETVRNLCRVCHQLLMYNPQVY